MTLLSKRIRGIMSRHKLKTLCKLQHSQIITCPYTTLLLECVICVSLAGLSVFGCASSSLWKHFSPQFPNTKCKCALNTVKAGERGRVLAQFAVCIRSHVDTSCCSLFVRFIFPAIRRVNAFSTVGTSHPRYYITADSNDSPLSK